MTTARLTPAQLSLIDTIRAGVATYTYDPARADAPHVYSHLLDPATVAEMVTLGHVRERPLRPGHGRLSVIHPAAPRVSNRHPS